MSASVKLKTKFPCRLCGEPTEVKRLSDGPRALCRSCSERNRLISCGNYADAAASRLSRSVTRDTENIDRLRIWTEHCEERLSAARRYLEAVPVARPGERRRIVSAAGARIEMAMGVLKQLAPLVSAARDEATPFEVLDGMRTEIASPTEPLRTALTLLPPVNSIGESR